MRKALVPAALLLILAGCGDSPAPAAATVPALADEVEVTCSPTGTQVSTNRFAAQPDGVHIRIRNTSGRTGVYLHYSSGSPMRPSGGEPVDSGTVLILGPPPGPVQLNCAHDTSAEQDPPVQVEVLDPAGAWQTGALEPLGCSAPELSTVDWSYKAGRGAGADAALTELTAQFDKPVTWRHVQNGYAEARDQTYVLSRTDGPYMTATLTRADLHNYYASPGSLCRNPATR